MEDFIADKENGISPAILKDKDQPKEEVLLPQRDGKQVGVDALWQLQPSLKWIFLFVPLMVLVYAFARTVWPIEALRPLSPLEQIILGDGYLFQQKPEFMMDMHSRYWSQRSKCVTELQELDHQLLILDQDIEAITDEIIKEQLQIRKQRK